MCNEKKPVISVSELWRTLLQNKLWYIIVINNLNLWTQDGKVRNLNFKVAYVIEANVCLRRFVAVKFE